MGKTIQFKFCGGCNPIYDRKKVYEDINRIIKKEEKKDEANKTILVILNGCQRGCFNSKKFERVYEKIINTQNYLVKFHNKGDKSIAKWINEAINN